MDTEAETTEEVTTVVIETEIIVKDKRAIARAEAEAEAEATTRRKRHQGREVRAIDLHLVGLCHSLGEYFLY